MIRFNCDYSEGAHPKILEQLCATNMEQCPGYGEDEHCANAARLIKKACGREDVDVHFLMGGSQTNVILITAALRPHQAVLSPDSGHISVHEVGGVEASGHEVLCLPAKEGKITAEDVEKAYRAYVEDPVRIHLCQPKLVYVSQPTEQGTLYSRKELAAISYVCHANGLLLYVDGARLGYALGAEENDLDLPTLAALCDAFYIGGTKVGAMFGEALVIAHPAIKEDFRSIMKQRGGMLAKGRLLGVQFETLFTEDLYTRIGKHADQQALRIREAFKARGFPFLVEHGTNQQFPILPNAVIEKLAKDFTFEYIEKVDAAHWCVRFCTSWATIPEDVDKLLAAIESL